jgi:hypothetical protein
MKEGMSKRRRRKELSENKRNIMLHLATLNERVGMRRIEKRTIRKRPKIMLYLATLYE